MIQFFTVTIVLIATLLFVGGLSFAVGVVLGEYWKMIRAVAVARKAVEDKDTSLLVYRIAKC